MNNLLLIIIILVVVLAFAYVVLYANDCITKSRVGNYLVLVAALIVFIAIACLFFAIWKQPNVTRIDVIPFKSVEDSDTRNVIIGKSYGIHIDGLRHLSEDERRKIFHEFMEKHGTGSYTFSW